MPILRVQNSDGEWVDIPAIVGPQGPQGEPGEKGEPGKTAYQYAMDGGYTGTEQEFAAKLAQECATPAEVNAAVKKAAPRNLLDNSDFTNPVNQRGITECFDSMYTIDRWYFSVSSQMGDTSAFRKLDGCIQLNVGTGELDFEQTIENHDSFVGKRCTVAVNIEGTVYCNVFSFGQQTGPLYFGDTKLKFYSVAGRSAIFRITSDVDARYKLLWAALYEGEYTAETLPEYRPKGYGVELMECLRYYRQTWTDGSLKTWHNSVITRAANGNWLCSVNFEIPMRVTPTVKIYSPITETVNKVSNWNTDTDVEEVVNIIAEQNGFVVNCTNAFDVNCGYYFHYSASADLPED